MQTNTQQSGTIAIIGGYGSVGRLLSTTLAADFPGRVIIAGPHLSKAQDLASSLGNNTSALAIDVGNPKSYRKLFAPELAVTVIISCVELPIDSPFPEEVLTHGVHFTELSATYASHQRLMNLHPIAQSHMATAVVGVGLMPGLSSVMAREAAAQLDDVTTVSINILLGLGESHGIDAVRWMLRNIGTSYDMTYGNARRRVRSFTEPYKTTLLDEQSPRRFYRFNFSDQHMFNQSMPIVHTDSRMAFDSKPITSILGGAAKLGLLSLVKGGAASAFQKLVSSSTVGSSTYAVQAEASGIRRGQPAKVIVVARGEVEAKATALVAAYLCTILLSGRVESGVYPIEQVIDASKLYAYLTKRGITIQHASASS